LIREYVQLHDRSADWGALFVSGPLAGQQLSEWLKADLPERMSGQSWLLVYRLASVGEESWLVFMPRADVSQRTAQLASRGAVPCGLEAFEIWRTEAGWPQFGRDITDANLPQEVNRDAAAISFTKGCYLGQETVARLDALGHVNRLLTGLRWEGSAIPATGEPLRFDDQPVGAVTSSVWSPRLSAPLALAYVRPPHHHPGSVLQSAVGPAVVVDLRGTS
jgi:folate-binding protein YgfZ